MKVTLELPERPLTSIAAKVALLAVAAHVEAHNNSMTADLFSVGTVVFPLYVDFIGEVKVTISQQ